MFLFLLFQVHFGSGLPNQGVTGKHPEYVPADDLFPGSHAGFRSLLFLCVLCALRGWISSFSPGKSVYFRAFRGEPFFATTLLVSSSEV